MPKPFTAVIPVSMKAAAEAYHFSPAIRMRDQILISGIIGVDVHGELPPDFRSQVDNIFTTLAVIVKEAGATLYDVVSLNCYHAGDLDSQLIEFAEIQMERLGAPYPTVTGVGVTRLGLGALVEVSAVAIVREQVH